MEWLRTDDSIREVLDAHADMVLRIALTHLRHYQDAEDAVQEVFLRLCRLRHPPASGEHLKAWLIRVTVNYCRDVLGSAWRRRVQTAETLPPGACTPDGTLHSDLWELVRRLPPHYRAPLVLHDLEGYPTADIAKMLHQNHSTVRSRLARARALLRQQWKEGESDDR